MSGRPKDTPFAHVWLVAFINQMLIIVFLKLLLLLTKELPGRHGIPCHECCLRMAIRILRIVFSVMFCVLSNEYLVALESFFLI